MSIPRTSDPLPTAIVAAGTEETRVLLRGLLRLHHFRVLGECDGATAALDLAEKHRPSLLLVDATLAEGSASDLVDRAKERFAATRLILVAPANGLPPWNGRTAPDVVLKRPFRIRELADALGPSAPSAPA